jgi:hypothetical protein
VKPIFKILLTSMLLATVGFLAPSGVMAQFVKGGNGNHHTPGTTHGSGGSGGVHHGPFISKPGVVVSSALQLGVVIKLLQAAAQAWGMPFAELFAAFQNGEVTIIEISPGIFRVIYDGTTIDLILDDL